MTTRASPSTRTPSIISAVAASAGRPRPRSGGGATARVALAARPSLADITRRRQDEIERQERDDFDVTVMALHNIGIEQQNPAHGLRLAKEQITALESKVLSLQTQLSQALNEASKMEELNYDLSERVRSQDDRITELEADKRESERERAFLERELRYYSSHPSQLHTATFTTPPPVTSNIGHSGAIGRVAGAAVCSSALPTSLASPYDVQEHITSAVEPKLPADVEDRPMLSASTTPSYPPPLPVDGASLVSRSSKASLHQQLLSQSAIPQSTPLPASPSWSSDGMMDSAGDTPLVLTQTLEVAQRNRERRARLRESNATASPNSVEHPTTTTRPSPTAGTALEPQEPVQPRASSRVSHSRHDSPYPRAAVINRKASRHLEKATIRPVSASRTTPRTARSAQPSGPVPPAQGATSRQPLGPSNIRATVHLQPTTEGALMEMVKAVLSKEEVKVIRKLVAQYDQPEADLSKTNLLRRLRDVLLPATSRSSMAVKNKIARREVLTAFERELKDR